eukprot:2554571-Alexandrium_andersonii.AAC.1
MKERGVVPRALADDLTVFMKASEGTPQERTDELVHMFESVVDCTAVYLQKMGAKISLDKTMALATCPEVRSIIKYRCFASIGGRVEVRCHMRDLGSHITFSKKGVAPTATKRIRAACACCRRIETLQAPFHTKLGCIRSKVLPAALYGCASSPCSRTEVKKLGTACINALFAGSSTCRARALAQAMCGRAIISPEVQIFVTRTVALRRQYCKSERARQQIEQLLHAYADGFVCGAPGPVGLWVSSVRDFGLSFDCHGAVWGVGEVECPIFG